MTTLRRPFTPQPSPPNQPASNASSASSSSSASSVSGGEGEDNRSGQRSADMTVDASATTVTLAQASTAHGTRSRSALRGWTAHQSHGQATILFYVPRWTQRDALDVTIGEDFVVAGVRGEEPIVRARLTGRVDPTSSAWHLERRSSKRDRSRSRSRTRRLYARSSDQSSSGSGTDQSNSNRAAHRGLAATSSSTASVDRNGQATLRARQMSAGGGGFVGGSGSSIMMPKARERQPRSRELSRPISPVHSDSSGFDMLARSTDTLGSAISTSSRWTTADGILDPHLVQHSVLREEISPRALSHSATLSDMTGGDGSSDADARSRGAGTGSGSHSNGVRSMESSISVSPSQTSSGSGVRAAEEADDITRDAKLVTLHLDKIDGGIWPCIVAGPVPASGQPVSMSIARLISQQSQTLPTTALDNVLRSHPQHHLRTASFDGDGSDTDSFHEGQRRSIEGNGGGSSVNESTVTIDTIGSDDSTTVLGDRRHHSQQQRLMNDEEQYAMDAVSLTLVGMQHARRSATIPFGNASARDDAFAFECFRRAWRDGGVPAATELLVRDYLPLQSSSGLRAPYRQRLNAALGGPTAMARLYVSYAHLHMPSYEHHRPLLALPMSGLANNPFGAHHRFNVVSPTSPQLGGGGVDAVDVVLPPGPLQYLREAQSLDTKLVITESDWLEAVQLDEERSIRTAVAAAATTALSSTPWSTAASPTSRSEKLFDTETRGPTGGKRRKAGSSRRDKMSARERGTPDQGLLFVFVGRAALLSVVVAGGVAMAGWWRKASAGVGS